MIMIKTGLVGPGWAETSRPVWSAICYQFMHNKVQCMGMCASIKIVNLPAGHKRTRLVRALTSVGLSGLGLAVQLINGPG